MVQAKASNISPETWVLLPILITLYGPSEAHASSVLNKRLNFIHVKKNSCLMYNIREIFYMLRKTKATANVHTLFLHVQCRQAISCLQTRIAVKSLLK